MKAEYSGIDEYADVCASCISVQHTAQYIHDMYAKRLQNMMTNVRFWQRLSKNLNVAFSNEDAMYGGAETSAFVREVRPWIDSITSWIDELLKRLEDGSVPEALPYLPITLALDKVCTETNMSEMIASLERQMHRSLEDFNPN